MFSPTVSIRSVDESLKLNIKDKIQNNKNLGANTDALKRWLPTPANPEDGVMFAEVVAYQDITADVSNNILFKVLTNDRNEKIVEYLWIWSTPAVSRLVIDVVCNWVYVKHSISTFFVEATDPDVRTFYRNLGFAPNNIDCAGQIPSGKNILSRCFVSELDARPQITVVLLTEKGRSRHNIDQSIDAIQTLMGEGGVQVLEMDVEGVAYSVWTHTEQPNLPPNTQFGLWISSIPQKNLFSEITGPVVITGSSSWIFGDYAKSSVPDTLLKQMNLG